MHAKQLTCILLLSWSCAATEAPAAILQPAPPPRAPGRFAPGPELTPLALSCREGPFDPVNGLDDDCDGRIDDQPRVRNDRELLVVVSHEPSAQLELRLVGANGPVHAREHSEVGACEQSHAVTVERALFSELPPDRYTLLVELGAPCAGHEGGEVQAHLSVDHGKPSSERAASRGFGVRLTPGRAAQVATFELP